MFLRIKSKIEIIIANPNLRIKTPNIIPMINDIIAPIIKSLQKNRLHYQTTYYL
jgi:hypothetical protein